MNDLISWVRQQLDTDEQMATAAAAESSAEWREESSWLRDLRDPLSSQWRSHGLTAGANLISDADAAHIANNDPARVLRQVQAHRAILDEYEHQVTKAEENSRKFVAMTKDPALDYEAFGNVKTHGWEMKGRVDALKFAVRALVSIYSDRDGYNPEWSA